MHRARLLFIHIISATLLLVACGTTGNIPENSISDGGETNPSEGPTKPSETAPHCGDGVLQASLGEICDENSVFCPSECRSQSHLIAEGEYRVGEVSPSDLEISKKNDLVVFAIEYDDVVSRPFAKIFSAPVQGGEPSVISEDVAGELRAVFTEYGYFSLSKDQERIIFAAYRDYDPRLFLYVFSLAEETIIRLTDIPIAPDPFVFVSFPYFLSPDGNEIYFKNHTSWGGADTEFLYRTNLDGDHFTEIFSPDDYPGVNDISLDNYIFGPSGNQLFLVASGWASPYRRNRLFRYDLVGGQIEPRCDLPAPASIHDVAVNGDASLLAFSMSKIMDSDPLQYQISVGTCPSNSGTYKSRLSYVRNFIYSSSEYFPVDFANDGSALLVKADPEAAGQYYLYKVFLNSNGNQFQKLSESPKFELVLNHSKVLFLGSSGDPSGLYIQDVDAGFSPVRLASNVKEFMVAQEGGRVLYNTLSGVYTSSLEGPFSPVHLITGLISVFEMAAVFPEGGYFSADYQGCQGLWYRNFLPDAEAIYLPDNNASQCLDSNRPYFFMGAETLVQSGDMIFYWAKNSDSSRWQLYGVKNYFFETL